MLLAGAGVSGEWSQLPRHSGDYWNSPGGGAELLTAHPCYTHTPDIIVLVLITCGVQGASRGAQYQVNFLFVCSLISLLNKTNIASSCNRSGWKFVLEEIPWRSVCHHFSHFFSLSGDVLRIIVSGAI